MFLCAADPKLSARTIILDKAQFPRDKICAGAIGDRAIQALASIGVEVNVPTVAVHALSVSTQETTRRYVMPSPTPIGRVIRRHAFDAALLDAVRQRGVAVRTGVRVKGIVRRPKGLTLQTSRGEVSASLVVGADGVGSFVRRWLDLPQGLLYAQAVEVDTPIHTSDPPPDTLHFDLTATTMRGYGWDFPTLVKGQPMVCRGVYELVRGAGQASEIDVAERLSERLRDRGFTPESYRFKRFAERGLAIHEPYGCDRVVLAGEAAGIDPVLGEGIAQAILYGQAIGPYLARAVRERSFSLGGYEGAIRGSRVGLDLSIRGRLPQLFYGRGRPIAEHWLSHSPSLALAGMHYFAGQRVPRAKLARASLDLIAATLASVR